MALKPEQLTAQIRDMALFRRVAPLLLESGADLKAAMWTREILTFNLNTLIDRFLSSDSEHIDEFLKGHLEANFPGSDRRKQLFCFNLIMSLNNFAPKHAYLRLYQRLLSNETEYAYYNFFWELKAEVLALRLERDNFYADLDKLFLDRKKWQLLLKKSLFFDHKQVLEFEAAVGEKVLKMKRERTVKYVSDLLRNEEFCATFFIQEVLDRFATLYKTAKEKKGSGKGDLAAGDVEEPVQEAIRRATQNRASRAAVQAASVPSVEIFRAKQVEKERLKTELRNQVALSNKYKQSAAKLVSYIQVIDPIVGEAKGALQKQREAFVASRKQASKSTESNEAFSSATTQPMNSFLDQGSNLYSTNGSAIKRKLLGLSTSAYSKLEDRAMDHAASVKALASRLRRIIFDISFGLAQASDKNDVQAARAEVDRLFAHYRSLDSSQVAILDTYFKNVDESDKPAAGAILDNVSKKFLAVVEKGLETSAEGPEFDSAMKKDFETFKAASENKEQQTEPTSKSRSMYGAIKASILQAKKPTLEMSSGTNDDFQAEDAATDPMGAIEEEMVEVENRSGASYSFAAKIQPMHGGFQKRGYFVMKKSSNAPYDDEPAGSFYEVQRNQSTQDNPTNHEPPANVAERKPSEAQKKNSQHSRDSAHAPAQQPERQSIPTQDQRKASGSSHKKSEENVFESAVKEAQAAPHRESRKLEIQPPNLPENELLQDFASFKKEEEAGASQKEMHKESGFKPKNPTVGKVSVGQAPVDPSLSLEDSQTKNLRPSQGGKSVDSPEIEQRYSSIPKDAAHQGNAPHIEESADNTLLNELHNKSQSRQASQADPGSQRQAAASDRNVESPEGDESGDDPALVDRIKDQKFVNTKEGKKMAQEIGMGVPGEKKVAKNFLGEVFFGKK